MIGGNFAMPSYILIHGGAEGAWCWDPIVPLLRAAKGVQDVVAVDLPGFGERRLTNHEHITFDDSVATVVDHADRLDLRNIILVGHSMGSFVAHQVASANPGRVSRLVLVASAPTCVGNPVLPEIWKTSGSPDFKDPIDPKLIEAWQTGPNPVDPAFFAKVLEESAKPPARVWKACLRGLMTDDHRFFLKDIKTPTRIIWGDKDTFFSKTEQDALVEAIPDAVLIPYPGGGHNVQWETGGNEKVAAHIRAFLGKP